MIVRARGVAAGLIVLLFGPLLSAQFTFPAVERDGMETRLTVTAAARTAEPGRAEVTLTLTVKGPATLSVEEPHLSDATDSWKEERLSSTRTEEKDKKGAIWSQIIYLKQVKAGVESPPDVSLRFRKGPEATWEEAKWVDIFKQMRGLEPTPEPAAPPSPWWRRWRLPLLLGLGLLLLVGVWLAKRRRDRLAAPLPADLWALRELARIEQTLRSPQGDTEVFHTQLSHVVRRYFAERFGLHALEQTTAEFVETVRQVPHLSAEQQTMVRDLFERCDLAKFARASTPPEECRQTVEMARTLVRRTTPALDESSSGARRLLE